MKYLLTVFTIAISSICFSQVVPVVITGAGGNGTVIDLIDPTAPEATAQVPQDGPHTVSHSRALFTISTDLAQYFLCQPNIDLEYHITYHSALGINVGLVEPCLLYAENPIATGGQYTDPGTVYGGTAWRFYYKFYPGRFHKSYWMIQGVYKKLSYNGVNFSDNYDNGYATNFYTMNEKETVYGIEVMHGNRISREGDHLYVDIFYGFGVHERLRNYQVTNQNIMLAPGFDKQDFTVITPGDYSAVINAFTPVIGLKFGWNYLKKVSN